MTDLGTLGGASSSAHGINSHGTIVGDVETSGGDTHVFSDHPATHAMADLGTLGGDYSGRRRHERRRHHRRPGRHLGFNSTCPATTP